MQKTRVRRVGALVVGLSIVAAACGSDDDAASSTNHRGTEAEAETTRPRGDDRSRRRDDRGHQPRPGRGGRLERAPPVDSKA